MEVLIEKIIELLTSGEAFALVTLIDQKGSAPRGVGSKMLVRKNAGIEGTIGGGLLEAEVIKLGVKVLEERKSTIHSFDLTQEDAAGIGMACGGRVSFLINAVIPEDAFQMQLYQEMQHLIKSSRKFWLLTSIPVCYSSGSLSQCLIQSDGSLMSNFNNYNDIKDIISTSSKIKQLQQITIDNDMRFIVEPMGNNHRAFLFGAGHITHRLEPILRLVGFSTYILDDRAEFANRDRFSEADEVILLNSFAAIPEIQYIDENSYVIIVTRGHINDKEVLAQALRSKACYIGMIGSSSKKNAVYHSLLSEGFTTEELEKVHCPIGLPIHAETPEEIAISVAAELIEARGEKNHGTA